MVAAQEVAVDQRTVVVWGGAAGGKVWVWQRQGSSLDGMVGGKLKNSAGLSPPASVLTV